MDAQSQPSLTALASLVETIAPWLLDVGSWIFGGLTAINLVVISALLTVGPVDAAIRASTAAFASALPLNLAGIVLLKLVKDMKEVGLDDLALRSFQAAGFPNIDAYFPSPEEREAVRARRSRVTLLYASRIAALSIVLTLTGLAAALAHMAWWIALTLLVAVAFSALLVAVVTAHTLPPASAAEKALKRQ